MSDQTVTVSLPCPIARACANESSRYAINGWGILAAGDGFVAAATDGRILAWAGATIEGDLEHLPNPSGLIGSRLLPADLANRAGDRPVIECNGVYREKRLDRRKARTIALDEAPEGAFPPIADLIAPGVDRQWIGISPANLKRLAESIDPEGRGVAVGIECDAEGRIKPGRPMAVLPARGGNAEDGGRGLMMPVSVDIETVPNRWEAATLQLRSCAT